MAFPRIARFFALAAGTMALMALLGGSAAGAASSALGANGEVLRIVAGSYGDLFPEGTDAASDSEVLALEIRSADGTSERLLVPETASQAAESVPDLVYERSTNTAYLLWQGKLGLIHSVLQLTSFDGEAWGPVFEITGNPFTRKVAPQLHVIRDSYPSPKQPEAVVHRTTIHVAWGEETTGGTIKRWAPILIEDGRNLAWIPSWNLADFLADGDDPVFSETHAALRLKAGWKDNTAIIGLLATHGDRIGVLEVEVLPGELDSLADAARYSILNDGARFGEPEEMAQAVHDAIIESARGFHPATLGYIAAGVHDLILSTPEVMTPEGLADIAEQARYSILNDGARFSTNGLADDDPFSMLEVDRPDDAESHHLLKVTVRSLRDAPAGIGAEPKLYLSDHGTDVIVAWQGEGAVHYVESVEDGWSETRSIVLGDSLDAAGVESMLEARVASR